MKPFIPFTLEDIRSLSTESSFSQGWSYLKEGAVGKIIFKDDVFRGKVQGQYNYKVAMKIRNDKPLFKCSCPYEYGGLCKHEVAFALAILDGKYKIEGDVGAKDINDITEEEYRKIFIQTDMKTRIEFLRQALDKDALLRRQFVAFTRKDNSDFKVSQDKPDEKIKEIIRKIHSELKNLDIDDLVENFNSNAYEYGYEEGYIDEAEEMVREIFDKYSKKAKKVFEEGDTAGALIYILGCIEASFNAPSPKDTEYDILGDSLDSIIIDAVGTIVEKLAKRIEKIVIPDKSAIELIDMIASRIKIYAKPDEDMPFADDTISIEPLPYYFIFSDKILQSLAANETTARYLLNTLNSNKWNFSELAFLYFRIAEILKDDALWLDTAEAYAPDDKKVALQLLEKYKNDNNRGDFTRIARMTFEHWPREFDKYISDNHGLIDNVSLYVKALEHYVINKQSPEYYLELRKYLRQEQIDRFLSDISGSLHTEFYVQLLEIEKRYESIMEVVKKNFRDDYRFHKLISPLLNVYPDECFKLLQDKIAITLDKERGRDVYQRICTWLGLMSMIPLKEEETLSFINSVYNYKPNLPALKDEMRNAKLVSVKK